MLWLAGHAAASKVFSSDRAHFKHAAQVTCTSLMVKSTTWDIEVFWEVIHPERA